MQNTKFAAKTRIKASQNLQLHGTARWDAPRRHSPDRSPTYTAALSPQNSSRRPAPSASVSEPSQMPLRYKHPVTSQIPETKPTYRSHGSMGMLGYYTWQKPPAEYSRFLRVRVSPYGSFPKSRYPNIDPNIQYTIVLIIRTPKKVPLILGNSIYQTMPGGELKFSTMMAFVLGCSTSY